MDKFSGLCKIGELAKKAGVPRSTIHYYCQMGLIEPSEYSAGGYRLFEEYECVAKIQEIKAIVESKITLRDLREKMLVG
ncbi:MAG: MerR family transcriptional regulator [Elusimicrobiota bacterium]